MKMFIAAAAVSGALLVSGCANLPGQISSTAAQVSPALTMACNDAIGLANIAGLIPGVGAIVPYIVAGCSTAQGIAKLASDPTSTQWLGTLIGEIKTLGSNVGVKL